MDKSQLSNGQLGMLAAGISLFNSLAWQLSWAQISLSAKGGWRKAGKPVSEHFLRSTCIFIWICSNLCLRDPSVSFGFAVEIGIWWYLVNSCLGLYKAKPKNIWILFCGGFLFYLGFGFVV